MNDFFRRLVVPVGVLVAALVVEHTDGARLQPALLTPSLLVLAGRVVYGAAFLLAWRFRRGRIAWVLLLLAAAAEGLRLASGWELASAVRVQLGIILLLPLGLAVAGFLPPFPVLSRMGAASFGVATLAAAGVEGLRRGHGAALAARWQAPLIESLPDVALPQAALLVFLLAGIALMWRLVRRPAPLEAGLFAALVAVALAFLRPGFSLFYLPVAGLVLGLALVENAFALAFEDGLTGLPARRALEERLRQLPSAYAAAMVDLDHFKKLNDRHGHEVGDQVLRMVAAKLARVGGGGVAYRYGGEEFTLLFPGKTTDQAVNHLETLCAAIADEPFRVRAPGRPKGKAKTGRGKSAGGRGIKVTVSIGVAAPSPRRRRPHQVLKAADRALYRAKKAGRNRVVAVR